MLGVYYGNAWNSRSLPFMSSRLLTANGTSYPLGKVFPGGVLDEAALAEHGLPRLTGTFAYAMLMANAAIGALIVHCILFWGKDILRAYQSARQGRYDDRHHQHMATHYQETPWWWYVFILVGSFVLGVVVIVKEKLTLPIWAYVVALICGCIVTPFVSTRALGVIAHE
jgi:fluoride ion exporter CrcB/FEX